jgi:hypothetical protein
MEAESFIALDGTRRSRCWLLVVTTVVSGLGIGTKEVRIDKKKRKSNVDARRTHDQTPT